MDNALLGSISHRSLVFLVKKLEGKITEVCLAMKKRGFGKDRWNGAGGKFDNTVDKSIQDTARRETQEEIGVTVENLEPIGTLEFHFPHHPAWDQQVHVFLADKWQGEPTETEEMRPQWFEVPLPAGIFERMWAADKLWIPKMLEGKKIKRGIVYFGENDTLFPGIPPTIEME